MAHEHSNLGAWIARLRERDPDASLRAAVELVARYPMFDDYQQATARESPVVHLARRPEGAR